MLAHETGHVAKKHAIQQVEGNLVFAALGLTLRRTGNEGAATITSVYNLFRTLNKSRQMEDQADKEGITFAYEAGYDPNGLIEFFNGIAGGQRTILDTYLATHPAPEKRIEAARENPLVAETETGIRETVARAYAARGFPGLAATVRRGGNPFLMPPPSYPSLDPSLRPQRDLVIRQTTDGRKDLTKTFRARRVGITLQQILLINSNVGDLRWAYLAARAYAVQSRVDDCYARTLRVLCSAPGSYDGLAAYAARGMDDATSRDTAQGRLELEKAVQRVRGAVKPLERASTAVAAVLIDLNNHYVRPRGNSEPWLRYAALEGSLRYAETELARADKASGQAWRLLSLAQVRRYQARLTEIVPVGDPVRRALWRRLLSDRFGITRELTDNESETAETGMVTVEAALGKQTGRTNAEMEQGRADSSWADWIQFQKGIPENIATAMRLLTLDLEREIAAEAQAAATNATMTTTVVATEESEK